MRFHGLALVLVVAASACTAAPPGMAYDPKPQPSAVPSSVAPASRAPSTTPASAVALRPCAPRDVTGTFDHWGAAAGSYGGSFRVAPRSEDLCALPDHPITTFIDERGSRLRFVEPWPGAVTWVPVRAALGNDATFFILLFSNHGGDVDYLCASRTLPLDGVQIETVSGPITLDFPVAERPMLCIEPRERVYVEVHAREP